MFFFCVCMYTYISDVCGCGVLLRGSTWRVPVSSTPVKSDCSSCVRCAVLWWCVMKWCGMLWCDVVVWCAVVVWCDGVMLWGGVMCCDVM